MPEKPSKPISKNPLAQNLLVMMAGQNNVITVRRPFVNFTGTLERAMMLDQLLYWTSRSVMSGWVAKSDEEFQEELCLSRYSIRAAAAGLKKMNLIETDVRKFGGSPTQHYRVRMDELVSQWEAFVSRLSEIEQTDYLKSDNPGLSGIEQTLTETTTETTKLKEEERAAQKIDFSTQLQEALKELGVYVSTWGHVTKRIGEGWSEADVMAVIIWQRAVRKTKPDAAKGVVTRLREATKAPSEYYKLATRSEAHESAAAQDDQAEAQPTVSADDTVTISIKVAWECLIGQIYTDMPRADFQKYVSHTTPIHAEAGRWEIGVALPEQAAWLESRLTSTAERLLIGIVNEKIALEFVVVEGVAVETEA
jgi:hypothetical protein